MHRKILILGMTLLLGVPASQAKKQEAGPASLPLTPQQKRLVQEAIAREKVIIRQIQKSTPIVQSYIQDLRPDTKLYQVPVSDQYMIGRVDFGKAFSADEYAQAERSEHHGWFAGSFHFMSDLTKAFHLENSPTGFMAMMFIDPTGFDMQHYDFTFVRREFLGTVRTWVFDVRPKEKGTGRFFGRIWVEDEDGNVVRFNGTYISNPNDETNHYFHFDSWRMNVQPGVWAPAAIYIEDTLHNGVDHATSFKGQTTYWGYSLKLPTKESDAESMEIENAEDQSGNSTDVSPLQAEREWISQAENNVLDRLTQAGLVAPPSDFDKQLEQVATNIIIGSNLQLPSDIHCRVILTTPLESLAVGNTILLSKGLIDTLPDENALAAVIAFQLAHIVTGHHIDTRYAFNDRLLFPDTSTFRRITMNHSVPDDDEAAKKAVDLYNHSIYASKAASVGLFFEQLEAREKDLPALFTPRLGDPLMRADGQPWLAGLTHNAPKLDMDNLQQIAALPLNSRLKIDPWDDKVFMMNARPPVLLNARDKMPLEITPVYFRLQRYSDTSPAAPAPANATPAASNTVPPSADAGAQQPSASAQAQPQGTPQ
ncbi:MAG TPA: M48 family metalloprotease [Acidobacteriaceae bacterium]|nr:M48 family metalloprotease [Acidobacteriaceae bacterium]